MGIYPPTNISHLPWGRCGLKHISNEGISILENGHLPWGRCGLKLLQDRFKCRGKMSSPVREMWIETGTCLLLRVTFVVISREGDVDWNPSSTDITFGLVCHLPRGRCGLKLTTTERTPNTPCHLPRGRCGLKQKLKGHKKSPSEVISREGDVDWNRNHQ